MLPCRALPPLAVAAYFKAGCFSGPIYPPSLAHSRLSSCPPLGVWNERREEKEAFPGGSCAAQSAPRPTIPPPHFPLTLASASSLTTMTSRGTFGWTSLSRGHAWTLKRTTSASTRRPTRAACGPRPCCESRSRMSSGASGRGSGLAARHGRRGCFFPCNAAWDGGRRDRRPWPD